MKIGLRLFLSSATFSIVIAGAYWWLSHEITGTFLLGFMAFGMCVIAGYMIVAEKDADLASDDGSSTSADRAGELVGTFTVSSVLPFWSAFAASTILLGLVITPALSVLGLIALLALGVGFIVRS